ncbi:hypothetical protein [Mycolicibacterium stellerae]|uniref:hypothetical protein n=1 Tax=Mycolicibacterium stellerae TaxID=2358193 RepID=UPI000F0B362F|nr:hypothetical protein [Mycolicibacterium stellerae]
MPLKTFADVLDHPRYVELSFAATDRWITPPYLRSAARTADTPFDVTAILAGDSVKGPLILLLAVAPGIEPPDAPAHGHASDNFRISLCGTLPMGSQRYGAGEFRFQRGWKPYASDNYAHGTDGGWTMLCFADRRGARVRHVDPDAPAHGPADANLAAWLGIGGDLTSNDPHLTAGDSALAVNFGVSRKPHLNGSYAQASAWPGVGTDTRAMGALLGDPQRGPLMVMSRTSPNALSASRFTVDTELVHVVVRGSCTIGDQSRRAGDIRVTRAGAETESVVAGPDGVDELIVLGDRSGALPRFCGDARGWPSAIEGVRAHLVHALHGGASD